MIVVGNIEVKGFLRVEDLDDGEVFAFLDDDTPYIVAGYMIINLVTGESIDFDDVEERPVRRLNATLVIKEEGE